MEIAIYCKGDNTYHYKSELPKSIQEFVNYRFSSGPVAGDDFKRFNVKIKNAVKKKLPEGYKIHQWDRNHYIISAVIQDDKGRFIYLSISDVRFWENEWFSNILIRTMDRCNDWTGGLNHYTTLFTLTDDLKKLRRD